MKKVKNIFLSIVLTIFVGTILYSLFFGSKGAQSEILSFLKIIVLAIVIIIVVGFVGYLINQYIKNKATTTTATATPATTTGTATATPTATTTNTPGEKHWFAEGIEWFFEKFRYPILVGITIVCLYLGFKGLTWLHAPALEAKKTWLGDKEYVFYNPFKGDGKMTEKERAEYNLRVAQENRKTSNWYNFWHGVPKDESQSEKNTKSAKNSETTNPYFKYEKPNLKKGDVYINGHLHSRGKTVEFSDAVISADVSKPITPSPKPNSAQGSMVIRN